MKIVTKKGLVSDEYTELKRLRYSPSVNAVSDRVSIDEFEADIVTEEDITDGWDAELHDDKDNLWAAGRIMYAEHEDPQIVHVRVQSELVYLDRKKMPAKMYTGQTVKAAIQEVASVARITMLFDDSAVQGKTVSGFCPEQTCRERLQHILFASGLFVTSSFVEHPKVTSLSSAKDERIPDELIYWRPRPQYEDDVTAINVTSFAFVTGTPTSDDETVTDGTTKWIVTRTKVTLTNPNITPTAATNEIDIEDVMLISDQNVSAVASMLGSYYFQRMKVEADVINNGEFEVGNTYTLYLGDGYDEAARGFCESLDYTFGLQAKSRIVIGSCSKISTPKLTVIYRRGADKGHAEIARKTYRLPAGIPYSITTIYIRKTMNGTEYVFRPTVDKVTGTMGDQAETVYVTCAVALALNPDTRILTIVSVDEFEKTSREEDGKTIYTLEID